ncbi:dihydrofolate reductase [Candidatus Uhrbacteria bacterium]|jgi:dihydrofolate reductase|nr:dihydrofolate reductase [Candidatus Uhrbacteria bacterium]
MDKNLYIIAAVDNNNGIGKDGKLPWHFKTEMAHFKSVTTKTEDPNKKNMVIMGRTTWESIPESFRPLPERVNVVLTRRAEYEAEGALVANSFEQALELADDNVENIFAIGGMDIYSEAMERKDLSGIYLTRIDNVYDVDTYFPGIPGDFSDMTPLGADEEDGVDMLYMLLKRA